MPEAWRNKLFFGDNLHVLREHIPDESVDLTYLDPPFNSNASYNVLFKEKTGTGSSAQIMAFEDTWAWGPEAEKEYFETVTQGPQRLADLLKALRTFLGQSDMMAYLTMMAPRLAELHRVLKPTGSIYLHCDPTASHYLKLVMDAVFGPDNFRSEIIWRRSSGHNKVSRQYGPIHDTILFYSKSASFYFRPGSRPPMRGYIKEWFTGEDEKGAYRTNMLTGPGTRTGSSGLPWHGFDPTSVGRHWAIPRSVRSALPDDATGWSTQESLDYLHAVGLIYIPRDGAGQPKYKQYVGEGIPYQDIWAYQPYTQGTVMGTQDCIDEDVKWLEHDKERLGYPTQKPTGLLMRIVSSSCPLNGLVLDAFCGCGTAVEAAARLQRHWIGIDITYLAIEVIQRRMRDRFGEDFRCEVEGIPTDLTAAAALANKDRYQFELWALGRVDAHSAHDGKKGADRGVDGCVYFFDDESGKPKKIVVQVKSGHVQSAYVRDLKGVVEREKAVIGALITLEEPSKPMRDEATTAGFYEPEFFPGRRYPKIQIITVQQLLDGARIQYPAVAPVGSYARAERHKKQVAEQPAIWVEMRPSDRASPRAKAK